MRSFDDLQEARAWLSEKYGPGEIWQSGKKEYVFFAEAKPSRTPYIPHQYKIFDRPLVVHFIRDSSFRPSSSNGWEKAKPPKKRRR